MKWGSNRAALGGAAVVGLGAFVVMSMVAWRKGHGLRATWHVEGEAIARTFESRPNFASDLRPIGRYMANWDYEAHGVPAELPPLDVLFEGTIDVPQRTVLRVSTPCEVALRVDGQDSALVEAGQHSLELRWRHAGRPVDWENTSIALEWRDAGGAFERIPLGALSPPAGTSGAYAWWLLAILLALLSGAGTFWLAGAKDARVRFQRRVVLLSALIVFAAGALRFHDLEGVPLSSENADELFAVWNGYSLLTEGRSRGWSAWPERTPTANVSDLAYWGERFRVITPYFEHPPLQHLVVASATLGATHWSHARVSDARVIAVVQSLIILLLIIAIGLQLAPRSYEGPLAAVVYALLPSVAIFNRVVKEEGLLTLLMLLSVWLALRYRSSGAKRDLVLGALAAGLCTFVKLPGIAVAVAYVALVVGARRWKHVLLAAGLSAIGVLLVLVYAYALDWTAFVDATAAQSGARPTRLDEFVGFFTESRINHNRLGRPWLIFLWIATAVEAREESAITVPLVTYMGAIGLASGTYFMGWYSLPLYPFLCLGAARFLLRIWRRPRLLEGALFVLLPLMYTLTFWFTPNGDAGTFPQRNSLVVGTAVLLLAPFGLAQLFDAPWARRLGRAGLVLACLLFVASCVHIVADYDAIYRSFYRMDMAAVR